MEWGSVSSCVSQSLELPELGVLSGCPCTPTLPGSQEMGGCLLLGAGVGKLRRGDTGRLWQSPGVLFQLQGRSCSAVLLFSSC